MTKNFGWQLVAVAAVLAAGLSSAWATDYTISTAYDANLWTNAGIWTPNTSYPGLPGDTASITKNDPNHWVFVNDPNVFLWRMTAGGQRLTLLPLNGGTITFDDGVSGIGWSQLYLGSGANIQVPLVLNDNLGIRHYSGTITLGANITGNGALALFTPTTLSLYGTNTYSGGTRISGGGICWSSVSMFYPGYSQSNTGVLALYGRNTIAGNVELSGGMINFYADKDTDANWGVNMTNLTVSGLGLDVLNARAIGEANAGGRVFEHVLNNVTFSESSNWLWLNAYKPITTSEANSHKFVIAGTLTLAKPGETTLFTTNWNRISGTITGSGSLAKAGSGYLVFTNSNNNYSGGTVIGMGILEANAPFALGRGLNGANAKVDVIGYGENGNATWATLAVGGDGNNVLQNVDVTLHAGQMQVLTTANTASDNYLGGNIIIDSPLLYSRVNMTGSLNTKTQSMDSLAFKTPNVLGGSQVYTQLGGGPILKVLGNTTLAGPGVDNVFNITTGNLNLSGIVTGSGTLVKTATGALYLKNLLNNWTGGVRLYSGTTYADSRDGNVLGTGPVAITGGTVTYQPTLIIRPEANVGDAYYGQPFTVSGYATLNTANPGTAMTLRMGNLTLNDRSELQYAIGGGGMTFGVSTLTVKGTASITNYYGTGITYVTGLLVGDASANLNAMGRAGYGIHLTNTLDDSQFFGNVTAGYGATFVASANLGTMLVEGNMRNAAGVKAYAGGVIDLTGSKNLDRLSDSAVATLAGGKFQLDGVSLANVGEKIGAVNLLSGDSTVQVTSFTNGTAVLDLGKLSRSNNATVMFQTGCSALPLVPGARGKVLIGDATYGDANLITLTNGILGGWARTFDGNATYDWATLTPDGNGVTRYTGYVNADAVTKDLVWEANLNISASNHQAWLSMTADRVINSLKNANTDAYIDANGYSLNVNCGILVGTRIVVIRDSNGGSYLTGGGDTGGGSLFIVNSGNYATINVPVRDTWNDSNYHVTLVKAGPYTTYLQQQTNSYTGGTVVNGGLLDANSLGTGGVTLAAGSLTLRTDSNAGPNLSGNFFDVNNDLNVQAGASTLTTARYTAGDANIIFRFNDFTLADGALFTYTGSTQTDLQIAGTTKLAESGGRAWLTVSTANQDVYLDGMVTGSGTLVKKGAGTLSIRGANNNWTGGWLIEGGVIEANRAGALGSGNGTVAAGYLYARAAGVLDPNATYRVEYGGTTAMGIYLYDSQPQNTGSVVLSAGRGTSGYPALYLRSDSNKDFGINLVVGEYGAGGDRSAGTWIDINTPGADANVKWLGVRTLTINDGTLGLYSANAYSFFVSGKTTLMGSANIENGAAINSYLIGEVTGSGSLTVSSNGNQRARTFLLSGSNSYTGGTILGNRYTGEPDPFGGIAAVYRGDPNALGSGDITCYPAGTLQLISAVYDANRVLSYRNNVVVAAGGGKVTFSVGLMEKTLWTGVTAVGDANCQGQIHQFQDLTIGNNDQLWLESGSTGTATHYLEFAGTTTLLPGGGQFLVSTGGGFRLTGKITGSGRLVANGPVWITGNGNDYTGGTEVCGQALHVQGDSALGSGPVEVNSLYATLSLEANHAANANQIHIIGSDNIRNLLITVPDAISGTSSLLFEGFPWYTGRSGVLKWRNSFSGGITLRAASDLMGYVSQDPIAAGNPIGSGMVTLEDSTIYLDSNTDYVWGNDIEFKGRSSLVVDRVAGTNNTNRLQTFGTLVVNNVMLDPNYIVRKNGYQVAFSGLDLTGGLTISGLDLSFNRDPAKRVSILGATNLTVSADANLYIGGTADMLTDTVVDANFHLSIVNNNQVFVTGTAIHNAGNVSGPGLAASGRTNIAAGATLGVTRIRQQQVDVSGKLVLNGGAGPATSIVNALNIAGVTDAWTGLVDIRQGYLVLPSATASDVGNQVKQASNFAAFGSWDGTGGITSSSAAGDQLYGVGYADNAIAKKSEFGEANGLAYTGVLVRYTYVGDTNLDGITDLDKDYYNWSFGYLNAGNNTWYYGDFNYDGQVDLDKDYYIWSYGYLNQGSPLVGGAESAVDTSPSSAPVPEPATVGLLGLGLLGLLRRRSRKA